MQLTVRDVEIIRFINEFGFCELPQLKEKMCLEKAWMYEIMARLVKARLVNHHRIWHCRHGVYSVTSRGAKYTDLPPIERISFGQYEHQLSILKVHIKLQQDYPEAHWISERRLKYDKFYDGVGKSGHVADGILVFPDGRQIAIEVEMSIKGKNRIAKILRGYSAQFEMNEIWYYCLPNIIPILTAAASNMPFIKIFNLNEFLL
jgi:hypothetical protein